ncbi:alpha/beta hydrolase [Sphingomonas parva]|uniref:Alpha/beta hydrolase n=1 Tax=Sphingomonas parva TaxID=2555898 RepID=A0A4Y8ZR66_9SPHN|nr:alpha/beta hydrolase [Sphingomonas parva]TFI57772.1 alpha/beta hydrolase [Sphingomonas parva]
MARWSDGYWSSSDGLRLHYRDYAGDAARPPIVCIPGLTRNARDFEGVAERLAGRRRLICVDLRGRGQSEHSKDPMLYVPPVYVEDMEALIAALGLTRFVLFGTSLGGLITMLLAQRDSGRIAAALLNDIGPVLETRGLEHIRSYVGRSQSWPTWLHAARALCEMQSDRYPDWPLEQWLVYAKRVCRLTPNGRIVFDYDMRLAEPFKMPAGEAGFDLWPAFRSLDGVPSLVVRGELSDLLSEETVKRMCAEVSSLEAVTVPRVGHAPTLDEPIALDAIDRLLARGDAADC